MAILGIGKKEAVPASASEKYFVLPYAENEIQEKFLSFEPSKPVKFPRELGEEPPFDDTITEGVYCKFGLATSVIDKYVDFIVGAGFYVVSDNPKAQKIIEDFNQDVNFDLVLRSWVKESLVKRGGFLELGSGKNGSIDGVKVLDAKYMYVKRDERGNVLGYSQYVGAFKKFDKTKIVPFEEKDIAFLPINQVGNSAYGLGIISPVMDRINKYLQADKDLHMIMSRKANNPYIFILGSFEHKNFPSQAQVDSFGQRLEYLNNKQEWVFGANVAPMVLNSGDIGQKFSFVMDNDTRFLLDSWQMPEVIMGHGNIPEGLAQVQKEVLMMNVQSKQAQIEKVIEEKIYKRVLNSQGIDAHVEFEWGMPSASETNAAVVRYTSILNLPMLSPMMRQQVELKMAQALEIDEEDLESPGQEREGEEQQPQPLVPGQNEKLQESLAGKDYALTEWLGFNYAEYLLSILEAIAADDFAGLAAATKTEALAGKLTKAQVEQLRSVLSSSFRKGSTMREIADSIDAQVKPKNLYGLDEQGKIMVGSDGKPVLRISAEYRGVMIGRTETTRLSAQGALANYRENNVKQVRWVAAVSGRTCPICEGLNGTIMEADNPEFMPGQVHPLCRCTIAAVVTK